MKRKFLTASIVFAVLASLCVPAYAAAATTSSGLSITPRKNYTIEPGKSVTDNLSIANLDKNNDLDVSLELIDFTFTDQSGTPKLLLDKSAQRTTWSLKPFAKLPDSVVVKAGKSITVPITITIPKNQGAGSYYSAIKYQASGTNGGNVSLNASGVSLAFVSIPGIVNEKMTLEKFGAYQPDKSGTSGRYIFIATDKVPDALAYALKNDGNVAESPGGSIVLKDMFGRTVRTFDNANPKNNLALIGQTRRFEACLNPVTRKIDDQGDIRTQETVCSDAKLAPGRYTANLDVFYGQNGNATHEINGVATFWYLPWWFIAAVSAGLLLIIYIIWRIVRKIRNAGSTKGISLKRKK